MVDIDNLTPIKLTAFAVMTIVLFAGIGIYFDQGAGAPASGLFGGLATLSVDEISINNKDQLVITTMEAPLGDSYELQPITPEMVEQATDGEKTIEKTLNFRMSSRSHFVEWSIANQPSKPIYTVNSERHDEWEPLEAYINCYSRNPDASTLALSLGQGWLGHPPRYCHASEKTGEAFELPQETYYFENNFTLTDSEKGKIDEFTITPNQVSSDITYNNQEIGTIAVIGGLSSWSQIQVPAPDWLVLNNDGDSVIAGMKDYPQNFPAYKNCLGLSEVTSSGISGLSITEYPLDKMESCRDSYLPAVDKEDTQLSLASQSIIRKELSEAKERPLFQITLDPDYVELKTVQRPVPKPSIKDVSIEEKQLTSGTSTVATFQACNDGDDPGQFRKYIKGDYISNNDRGLTQVIQPGECVTEEIDVTAICHSNVDNTEAEITLYPYNVMGDVEPASITITGLSCEVMESCSPEGKVIADSLLDEIRKCVNGEFVTIKECDYGQEATMVFSEVPNAEFCWQGMCGVCEGDAPHCGNDVCEREEYGENYMNCPEDCSIVPPPEEEDNVLLGLLLTLIGGGMTIAGGVIYFKK